MYSRTLSIFLLLLGVILPVIALVFEIFTGGCANLLFDPIPSWLHVLLVAYVPTANFILLRKLWHNPAGELTPRLSAMNSATLVISGVYTIAFLPVTHAAVIGILLLGLGALALSPLLSFITALLLAKRLRMWRKQVEGTATSRKFRATYIGMVTALGLLFFAEIPRLATLSGVELARSQKPAERGWGLGILRTLGDERMLLEACYQRGGALYDFMQPNISTENARKLYFQVTGESFNDVARGELIDFNFMETRGRWDGDLGGDEVGQIIPEVSLTSSRLDGVLYPESGVGYVEWTMVFHNEDEFRNREARFILRPPTGGVTSRVTLWINGEPREAAFGKTSQVREAYQQVAVRQGRDPLLVTALGTDTNLVQCFPILPGDDMKIRIGMSFPLQQSEEVQVALLPRILDQNFLLSPELTHNLWYEAPGELSITHPGTKSNNEGDLKLALDDDVFNAVSGITTNIAATQTNVAVSPFDEAGYGIETQLHKPGHDVFLVVNGSAQMERKVSYFAEWLKAARQVEIWFAGDEVEHFNGSGNEAIRWLSKRHFVGGQDSLPALVEAVEVVSEMRHGTDKTIWWLDAGQPVTLENPDGLQQLYERRDPGVTIVYCPMSEKMNRLRQSPPLAYAPSADLLAYTWQSMQLTDLPADLETPVGAGPEHLYRVVLANELRGWLANIYRGQSALKPSVYKDRMEAKAALIAAAQLVTPITGAVVLETKAQYDANDLEAVDPDSVPNVPEPEQAALLIGTLIALALLARRHFQCRRT